jgi:nucleotide-binding universal stress UspA family protein
MQHSILVGTHGKPGAAGALRTAAALAPQLQAKVHVITVLEPLPIYDYGFGPIFIPDERVEAERSALRIEQIRQQLRNVVGAASDGWHISCRTGSAGAAIVEAARAAHTAVIVLGIGRHAPADRLLGGETVVHVSRAVAVPVLAVSEKAVGLPERALITTDFSTSSLNAARVAMQFLAEGAQVTLAHVMPEIDLLDAGRSEWERVYRTGVDASAARMIEEIDPLGVHKFNVVVLHGDPAEQLVALAHRTPVDLIVAGSHGRTGLERLMLGSVATKLLRAARCSVLLAPPEAALARAKPADTASQPASIAVGAAEPTPVIR